MYLGRPLFQKIWKCQGLDQKSGNFSEKKTLPKKALFFDFMIRAAPDYSSRVFTKSYTNLYGASPAIWYHRCRATGEHTALTSGW